MRASGPVAIRTGTLIRKTGCRGPLGTAAARHVIRWNRKALLVEDLLHQVGGGLGECERSSWCFLSDGRLSSCSCLLLRRAARRFVVFLSLYLLLFFCCAFTIGRKVCVRHAAIAISIVDSSVHLKERIKNGHIFCCAACRSVVLGR